jgi:hypothetical protein
MNSIVINTVAIREDSSHYLIRYQIENDRFAEVLSSVSSCSVLLLGLKDARNSAASEPQYSLIAAIPLGASVDPGQTVATFDGKDLELRLVKSPERQVEGALIPVTERAGINHCERQAVSQEVISSDSYASGQTHRR